MTDMPQLLVYSTGRESTSRYTIAFAQGANAVARDWTVEYRPIQSYKTHGFEGTLRPGIDAVCALGILRGTGAMIKEAAGKGIDYFYMDHAYYDPGYDGKGWLRITKNGHSCNSLRDCSPKLFKSFKSIKINKWQPNTVRGRKIIICPPTQAVAWYTGLNEDWGKLVAQRLRELLPESEHDRIHIRNKPNDPIVDDKGELLGFKTTEQTGSLEDDLLDAYCVIAYNSMVALTATLMGIPVIVSEISCCKPVSFSLRDFTSPTHTKVFDKEPENRLKLLYWLAKNQWTLKDIECGKAWKELQLI